MQIGDVHLHLTDTGHGTSLIWGHGLTASMAGEDALELFQWHGFSRSHRLIRYDARGHGQSQASYDDRDYLWPNLARDQLAIADNLGLDTFISGGQSMGCATALYTALQQPSRLEGLVLVNPPTAWDTRAAQGGFYRRLAKIGALLGGKGLARVMLRRLEGLLPHWLLSNKADKLPAWLSGLELMGRRALYHLFRGAASSDLPPVEQLAKLDMPVLILAWRDDASHPVSTAERLHAHLPNSTLVIAANNEDVALWPEQICGFVSDIARDNPDNVRGSADRDPVAAGDNCQSDQTSDSDAGR